MYSWVMNEASAIDADRYYDSLPRTMGVCPFCHEIVQDTHPHRWSYDGEEVAHMDCLNDAVMDAEDEEFDDELPEELAWIRRFPW